VKVQIEALYENGVFKPKMPPTGIADKETVCLTIERSDLLHQQAKRRIAIDPDIARQLGDSPEFGVLET